jgi:DNA end-binding protein Ku
MDVIKAKRKGRDVHARAEVEEEEAPDLITALRESIARGKSRPKRRQTASSNGNRRSGKDLQELPKSELDKRAKKAGIDGRSKMTKAQLARALEKAA